MDGLITPRLVDAALLVWCRHFAAAHGDNVRWLRLLGKLDWFLICDGGRYTVTQTLNGMEGIFES